MRSLEVLFDARIIDEGTPISSDGQIFHPLGELTAVFTHLKAIKDQLNQGLDPWTKPVQPKAQSHDQQFVMDDIEPTSPDRSLEELSNSESSFAETSPLRIMFANSVNKKTGTLASKLQDGMVYLYYRNGKIVDVATDIEKRELGDYLVRQRVCDASAIKVGHEKAPQMGGDLGTVLIALGLVPPHAYVEHYVQWARGLVGFLVSQAEGSCMFSAGEVTSPAVPLGFSRFQSLIEAIREGFTETELQQRLAGKKNCLLIPAHSEGATIDELKLDPKELRVLRAIDGTKTCHEIVSASRGRAGPAVRCIYLVTELGYVVFGDDAQTPRERDEARSLMLEFTALKKQNYYEVLNVKSTSSDEEVRSSYMKLAKIYHPDTVRSSAAEELVEIHKEIFAFVQDIFDHLNTEEKRSNYDAMLEAGVTTKEGEQKLVQDILEAENLFAKAQTYARTHQINMAIETVEKASGLKKDDAEFGIHLTYYKFLAQKEDRAAAAQPAIRMIEKLLVKEPRIASGHLFLGRLYKIVGEVDKAIKQFETVLAYDANNQEAKSELRIAKMRLQKSKKRGGLF
jgi:tetratricopeptide (TPR) repeat protein